MRNTMTNKSFLFTRHTYICMLKISPQYSSTHILCAKPCNHYSNIIEIKHKKTPWKIPYTILKVKRTESRFFFFMLNDKHSLMTIFFLLINIISLYTK